MNRYEDVPQEVLDLATQIISEHFPDLESVRIKYLFNLKKSKFQGLPCLGKCQKPNDIARHFSIAEAQSESGYDYVITLDKMIWDFAPAEVPDVRTRLLRHELRHVLVIVTDEERKNKILPHNLVDFVEEVALNADEPDWARKAWMVAAKHYKK